MYKRNRSNSRRCSCGCRCMNCPNCKELPVCPTNPQLANSYVPYQYMDEVFEPCDGLEHGTIFPELVSPYEQNMSQCIIQYLESTKTCEEVDDDNGC